MDTEQNAFLSLSNTMTEDACFNLTHNNNETSICNLFFYKKKYVAFFTGNLKIAADMYELGCQYHVESVGEFFFRVLLNYTYNSTIAMLISVAPSCSTTCESRHLCFY